MGPSAPTPSSLSSLIFTPHMPPACPPLLQVVGYDAAKDLAVLRLSMPKSRLRDLQPALLGSSAGIVVGQAVWGVGNPYGLDHTLTAVSLIDFTAVPGRVFVRAWICLI
jgi:hypothetical protein